MAINRKILLVECDETDLSVTGKVLQDGGYGIVAIHHPPQLVELLENWPLDIGAIILPEFESLPELSKCVETMQTDHVIRHVPIILRARMPADVIDRNLKSGMIFHHLSRSASPNRLAAICSAALRSYEDHIQLSQEVEKKSAAIGLIKSGQFQLHNLDEVNNLTSILSHACPNPKVVALGLSELMVNAIEHGNLGICYALKTQLLEEGNWREEIERRLLLPENTDKTITVEFIRGDDSITITIQDAGEGFDWRRYLTIDNERMLATHGRGIAIAACSAFDELSYIGNGNTVVATIFTTPSKPH